MKKLTIASCLMLVSFVIIAQTNTPRQQINYMFAPLVGSSYLTTNFLYDKAYSDVPLKHLNGVKDSVDTISVNTIKQLIWQEENAFMPSIKDAAIKLLYVDSVANLHIVNNRLPISIVLGKYNRFKEYILDSNLIDTNANGQLIEQTNLTQSPFEEFMVYAASVLVDTTTLDTLQFIIPSNLIYNSTGIAIKSMDINFDTDNGFINIGADETISIAISEPTIRYCKLKINFADGSVAYLEFSFGKKARTPITKIDYLNEIISEIPYNKPPCASINTGQYAKARYYIKYSYTRTDKSLHKPLIFVEGFDPKILDDIANNRYGDFGWDVLSSGGINARSGDNDYPNLAYMPTLLTTLLSAPHGYDVVLVDFENGGDYIQKNAYALIKIIQEINANKIGDEELVIVGTSMGGLISRYALRYMEDNNLPHCCRLWTSFDAPQNGANIPIGLQAGLGFFANFIVEAETKLGYLNTPAALQMLIRHRGLDKNNVDLNPSCYRNDLPYLFPEKLRKIALLNGNITSQGPGYGHSSDICDWRYSLLGSYRLQCNIKAQPLTNGDVFNGAFTKTEWFPNLYTIYRLTTWTKTEKFNCNGTCDNLDGAPGGYHQGTKDFYNEVDAGASAEGYTADYKSLSLDGRVCFIPSTSALAIYPHISTDFGYDIKNNLIHYWNTSQEKTPFESYYATGIEQNISLNESHVTPSTENSDWLLDQFQKNEYPLSAGVIPYSGNNMFNFASYHRRTIIKDVTVNSGGKLQVNGNYKSHWASNEDEIPDAGSTFKLFTTQCIPATIIVNSGGKFYIGDNNPWPNNKAIVTLSSGSSLHLKTGSELRIFEGSKLVLEIGAYITIEPGVIISLEGTNSILEVEGFINLTSNAVFEPTGLGFCRFINNTGQSIPHFYPQGNNQIIFDGTQGSAVNNYRKVLEIKGNYGFVIPSVNIDLFKINIGKVLLEPDNVLEINADNYLLHMTEFDKLNPSDPNYKGILVYGSPIDVSNAYNLSRIQYTKIRNAQIGIEGQLWVKGNGLRLNNVQFYKCDLALKTIGKNIYWLGGIANECGSVWEGSALDAPSTMLSVNINVPDPQVMFSSYGISTTGSSASPVYIENCKINNYSTGIYATGNDIYIKCSDVTNNYIGVLLDYDGKLILDNTTGQAGYNDLSNNIISIHPYNQGLLELQEGYSNINGSTPFDPTSNSLGINQTLMGYPGDIGAWNNYYGNFATPFYLDVNLGVVSYQAPINITPSITLGQYITFREQNCNYINGGGEDDGECCLGEVGMGKTGGSLISTSRLQNKTIEQAYNLSKAFVKNNNDSLRNYNTAIDYFDDILSLNYTSLTNAEVKLMSYSYNMYMSSLGGAIQKRQINVSRTSKQLDNQIQKVINRQNALLQKGNTDSVWMKLKNRIYLDKAITYRAAENRTKAIQLLDSILIWATDTSYILLVNTWKCQIQAENDLISGTIKNKDSVGYYYPCYGKVIKRGHKPYITSRMKINQTTSIPEIINNINVDSKVYPNPANDVLNLEFKSQHSYSIEILDINGKLLLTKSSTSVKENLIKEKIDIKMLANGLYFIKITSDNFTKTHKLIIE